MKRHATKFLTVLLASVMTLSTVTVGAEELTGSETPIEEEVIISEDTSDGEIVSDENEETAEEDGNEIVIEEETEETVETDESEEQEEPEEADESEQELTGDAEEEESEDGIAFEEGDEVNPVGVDSSLEISFTEYTLTIGGTGKMIAADVATIKSIINAGTLKEVKIGRAVESIYAGAFKDYTDLEKVTFEGTDTDAALISEIGTGAFEGCTGLTSISFPKNVKSIGSSAFKGCTKLKEVTFSKNTDSAVLTIGDSAFDGTIIEELEIPKGVKSIGSKAFADIITLKSVKMADGVQSIGTYAFSGDTKLSYVSLPNSLSSYGEYAFDGCTELTTAGPINEEKKYTVNYGNTAVKSCDFFKMFPYLKDIIVPGTITTIPANAFGDNAKSVLKNLTLNDGVKTIAANAFDGYTALTKVSFPSSLTTIGSEAFLNCSSLDTVNLTKVTSLGKEAFQNCSSLTTVTVPNTMTSIPEQAFKGCSSLKDLTLPATITKIGAEAFAGCSALLSTEDNDITLDKVSSIGEAAFEGCTTIKYIKLSNGIKSIGNRVFNGCTGLVKVYIPQSVTSIGNKAFLDCTSLTDLEMYSYVTSISDDAFGRCTGLVTVGQEDTTENIKYHFASTINSGIFDKFPSLTTVKIPSGGAVKTIGEEAFMECPSLTTVTIGSGVTTIGASAFKNSDKILSITIPSTVKSIGASAFEDCDILGIVSDASGLTTIGDKAFYSCDTFMQFGNTNNTVSIPSGVTSIGVSAFEDCKMLNKVVIPNTLTKIGNKAFKGCKLLKTLEIPSDAVLATIGDEAFCNAAIDTGDDYLTIPNCVTTIGARAFKNNGDDFTDIVIGTSVKTMGADIFSLDPAELTIHGFNDTKAESYAKEYSINFAAMSIKYAIDFNGNGSTGGSTNIMQNLYSNKTYTLTANGFTRTNYTFTGWNTKKDGTGTAYANKAKVTNVTTIEGKTVTLYAQWKQNIYKVTYVLNGGKNNSANKSTYDTTKGMTLAKPTRTNYTFLGWYLNGKKVTAIAKGTDKNVTLTAKWKQNIYKVTYVLNGGKNNSANKSTYDTTKGMTLAKPTRTNYKFAGWYLDSKFKNKITSIAKGTDKNITLYAKWTAVAKWVQVGSKYKYLQKDGTYAKNCWLTISGAKYHFDKNGYRQTGFKTISKAKYYFASNGKMQTGWKTIDGARYYFNTKTGKMVTGLMNYKGDSYYFEPSTGKMVTGLYCYQGFYFYFYPETGKMAKNVLIEGHYFGGDGVMIY